MSIVGCETNVLLNPGGYVIALKFPLDPETEVGSPWEHYDVTFGVGENNSTDSHSPRPRKLDVIGVRAFNGQSLSTSGEAEIPDPPPIPTLMTPRHAWSIRSTKALYEMRVDFHIA
ncbi:hypothetical protein C8R44DRAFT_859935 [Mycena epipterygia]|nr:hypothetical protein C8R44DRAFT_859935 [Mycena epipterygia]